MSSVSGFLSKTFEIFSDTSHDDICSWGPNGDTIQVKKVVHFIDDVTLLIHILRLKIFQRKFCHCILNILIFNRLFVN